MFFVGPHSTPAFPAEPGERLWLGLMASECRAAVSTAFTGWRLAHGGESDPCDAASRHMLSKRCQITQPFAAILARNFMQRLEQLRVRAFLDSDDHAESAVHAESFPAKSQKP